MTDEEEVRNNVEEFLQSLNETRMNYHSIPQSDEEKQSRLFDCAFMDLKPSFEMLFGRHLDELSRREILGLYTVCCFRNETDKVECLRDIILNW